MPFCQICNEETLRRHRIEGKLVCWICYNNMEAPKPILVGRIRSLEKEIKAKPDAAKRFSSPYGAVPPKDVLVKAKMALDGEGSYNEFSKVLGDYYGILGPNYIIDPSRVPEKSIACYISSLNTVVAKEKTITMAVAFHEFYHALESNKVVPCLEIGKQESQKNADNYSKACLKILGVDAFGFFPSLRTVE